MPLSHTFIIRENIYIYILNGVMCLKADRFAGHVFVVVKQEVFAILQSLGINNMTQEPKLPLRVGRTLCDVCDPKELTEPL